MEGFGRRSWLLLLCSLLIGQSPTNATEDAKYCVGDGPECVLQCMVEANRSMDFELYSNMIAPDYQYIMGDGEKASWGREEELDSVKATFENPDIESFAVTCGERYKVIPGPSEDSWVIEDVNVVIEVSHRAEPEPIKAEKRGLRLSVRKVDEPVPHYELFHLYEPEGSVEFETEAGESERK